MQYVSDIRSIMLDFAASTGLADNSAKPRRYLWTDAFAVCNFLELSRQTGEEGFLLTARKLVDQVHFVLGKYSVDDSRKGWISGLDEHTGYEHPTVGGLRIGKKLLERKAYELFDERLEWDRDGQYFHYLTKWMQALARIAAYTGEGQYQRWALELARASHAAFTYKPAAGKAMKMYWKMSVDLSRALVPSMGHHDPLDALTTYLELQATNACFDSPPSDIKLESEIAECAAMCEARSWATDDPLGTGSLLFDAWRLQQIRSGFDISVSVDLSAMLADCESGLTAFQHSGLLKRPAEHRLAFREFGLSIGLHALARLGALAQKSTNRFSVTEHRQLARLLKFSYLSEVIENFWLQSSNRRVSTWREHADINSVMLATSLAPDGYLSLSH
ncbi:MAG: hypothetical protein R3E64_17770 [Halioglobus sp.]